MVAHHRARGSAALVMLALVAISLLAHGLGGAEFRGVAWHAGSRRSPRVLGVDPCAGVRGSREPARETSGRLALVTGGAGFIGSSLCELLLSLGFRVRVLDNLSTGDAAFVPDGAEFVNGDVRDYDAVLAATRGAHFGELALLRGGPRAAKAAASSAGAFLLALSREDFDKAGGAIARAALEKAAEEAYGAEGTTDSSSTLRAVFGSDTRLADVELRAVLGVGAFGKVYLAKHRSTKNVCAIKSLSKGQLLEARLHKRVLRVRFQARINHPLKLGVTIECFGKLLRAVRLRPYAQVDGFQRPEPFLQRLAGERFAQNPREGAGKQGDDPRRPGAFQARRRGHQIARLQVGADREPTMRLVAVRFGGVSHRGSPLRSLPADRDTD